MAEDGFFNIKDMAQGLRRELSSGITTRIFFGENVMLSVVEVAANTEATPHNHPEEQWGLLLEGECVRIQGGREVTVRTGDFWHTPGGMTHTVRTGDEPAVILDVFSPPRKVYETPGKGFGTEEG
jgi:quercetin dioxygenase-like cupin family protein